MRNLFDIRFKKKFPFISITKENLSYILIICLITGFLGFFLETLFCLWICDAVLDRGFLCGPFIPIYAFAMFFILIFGRYPKLNFKNFMIICLSIGVGVSILEFIVGEGLEQLFGLELWDYRPWVPYSSHYVSLPVSVAWGVGGTLYYLIFIPFVRFIAGKISSNIRWLIIYVAFLCIFTDLLITIALISEYGEYRELYFWEV